MIPIVWVESIRHDSIGSLINTYMPIVVMVSFMCVIQLPRHIFPLYQVQANENV